jgi:translation initiation factor eIF-2B subunit gamma
MKAIVLAGTFFEEGDVNSSRTTTTTSNTNSLSFVSSDKKKPSCEQLVAFKPLLSYALEAVQKCALIESCRVVVTERDGGQFARECVEKVRASINSGGNGNNNNNSNKVSRVAFDVVEVSAGAGGIGKGDADVLREVLNNEKTTDDGGGDVVIISHKTVFDVPLEEIIMAHRRADASATVLLSERRVWDVIDTKYGRAPKGAKYIGLSDDLDISSSNYSSGSGVSNKLIKRLVFSASESEKTVKINRSALDSVGNVQASVRYRDVRVYCFQTEALVECLKKLSSNSGSAKSLSLKNDVVPEMCKAQFWRMVANNNNNDDDGKENVVDGNIFNAASEKPVVAVICRPEQPRDNFACEIERISPHFLEISKEILSSAQSLVGREPSQRHENYVASDVELGGKAIIGAQCAVLSGVFIGEKTHVKRSVISHDARIGANSKITNSVVCSSAIIEENCQIVNCVVGENAVVGKNSTLKECVVESECEVGEDENVREETLKNSSSSSRS